MMVHLCCLKLFNRLSIDSLSLFFLLLVVVLADEMLKKLLPCVLHEKQQNLSHEPLLIFPVIEG